MSFYTEKHHRVSFTRAIWKSKVILLSMKGLLFIYNYFWSELQILMCGFIKYNTWVAFTFVKVHLPERRTQHKCAECSWSCLVFRDHFKTNEWFSYCGACLSEFVQLISVSLRVFFNEFSDFHLLSCSS